MIQLPTVEISQDVLDQLKTLQEDIDRETEFHIKAENAEKLFSRRNVIGNKTFDSVKVSLDLMCSGARRCVYCEDSLGCEVEHIRPKSYYPEHCFDWENYVYACGLCNRRKSNKFAVFDGESHKILKLTKNKLVDKNKGEDVMINPRRENPLNYCQLDLKDKACRFVILESLDKRGKAKAEYKFLKKQNLNDVPYEQIRKGREIAYSNYYNRLLIYTRFKNEFTEDRKKILIQELKKESHPTVWKEMQRYHIRGWLEAIDEELNTLFENSPEALEW